MGPYGSCVSVYLLITGEKMKRSNRDNPCPICKRSSDGCLYAEDGVAAICVRIPEGSVKRAGQAGYLHILKPGDFKPKPVVKK